MTNWILIVVLSFIIGWVAGTADPQVEQEDDTPIYILSEPGYEQFEGFEENQEAAMALQRRLDKLKIKKLIGFIEEV